MKKTAKGVIYILSILISFLFIAACDCNKYEINTKIRPKILATTITSISIEYKLGPYLILDDLDKLKVAQKLYLDKHKDNIELDLQVKYGDFNSRSNGFYYSIEGTLLKTTEPVKFEMLMKQSDQIPGFKWLVKDNKTIKDDGEISKEVDINEPENKMKRLE